jgi:hypothetical protein
VQVGDIRPGDAFLTIASPLQQGGKAGLVGQTKDLVQLRLPQISVHEKHLKASLGHGYTQVDRSIGLFVSGQWAGD